MKIYRAFLTVVLFASTALILVAATVRLDGGWNGMDPASWTILSAGLFTAVWSWRLSQGGSLGGGANLLWWFILKIVNFFGWIAVLGWSILALIFAFGTFGNNIIFGVIIFAFALVPWLLRISTASLKY